MSQSETAEPVAGDLWRSDTNGMEWRVRQVTEGQVFVTIGPGFTTTGSYNRTTWFDAMRRHRAVTVENNG